MRNFKEMNRIKNAKAEIFYDAIYTAIKKHLGGENSVSFRMLADLYDEELNNALCNKFNVQSDVDIPMEKVIDAVFFILNCKPSKGLAELSEYHEEEFQKYLYRFVENMPKGNIAYQQLINRYMDNLPKVKTRITRDEIGCLENEFDSTLEAHLSGVKSSDAYDFLYSICSEELDTDFGKEFNVRYVDELPAEKLGEAMQFIGEWMPCFETLKKISDIEINFLKTRKAIKLRK